MRRPCLMLLLGGALPALAQTPAGSSVIDGIVSDTNLVALSGVAVSVVGTRVRVVTDGRGHFRVSGLRAGQTILLANRLGYIPTSASLQLDERDTARLSLTLVPVTVELDPLVITAHPTGARLTEFETRRKSGAGHFLTEAEIEKHNMVFVGDLLRTVPSVRVLPVGKTAFAQAAYNMRGSNACPYQIYLDGVYMPPRDPDIEKQQQLAQKGSGPQFVIGREFPPRDLSDLPSPKELAGIEVYSGAATIPLQYKRPDTTCGVILLWTKDGSSSTPTPP